MPGECIEFTLKGPVFGSFDKAILNGIFPKIKPLLPITGRNLAPAPSICPEIVPMVEIAGFDECVKTS
jgi:hypothetical protein